MGSPALGKAVFQFLSELLSPASIHWMRSSSWVCGHPGCSRNIEMTNIIPAALVVSRSAGKFRARCPYCLGTHGHGFPPEKARHEQGSRRSDCHDPGGDYRVQFHDKPLLGNPEYGWEFDRRYSSACCVAQHHASIGSANKRRLQHLRRSMAFYQVPSSTMRGPGEVGKLVCVH